MRAKLEARDFSALADLGVAPSSSLQFWSAYFQGCADCDTTQTLCIDAFTLSYDKNGKLQTKKSPIITRLLLTPDDTVAVATAAAMLSAPPAPDPAPEPAASPAASDAPESAGVADAIAESPGQDPSSPPAAV